MSPEGQRARRPPPLRVRRGTGHVVYAYDVANSIDLDLAERRIAAGERQTVKQKRRAPAYFEYRPAPLRVTWDAPAVAVAGFTTLPSVELVMYDFGAVSLSFSVPLTGPLAGLVALAQALRGNQVLLAESRRQVEQLMAVLEEAAVRSHIAPIVEDYLVFQIDEWDPPLDAETLHARQAPMLAQILRAESRPLSDQETREATSLRGSFGPADLTIIDTDAALVFDPDAADVRAVIEFANAQILEMRFLDGQLDESLEQSYQLLSRQRWGRAALFRLYDPDLRQVAQFQLDAATLFERVTNALKLIGEQYLTRIYGLVSRRFYLAAWDATISRKLQTIESIYTKMADRAASRRMELLEWIIIVLFAVSFLLPFLPGIGAK
ncbi:MAG: hypothetical protein HY560_02300 [Gemmatimonadetes bacterium]|nr:hypothetical protein [Gemmatimonadota bacterium]